MNKLTGGCYVRVSTENQLENYSIEEQIERLKSYCHAKEISIGDFYVDAGYSGGNTKRPALEKMLKDIGNKKINAVVVYKLDRLSRSQKDTLNLIEDKFKDIAFISVQENFDTSTSFGKAMVGILSVFAQLEKDQITERFTMGRIGRSRAGYYHGGSTSPFGYKYIDGKLIVDESEADQVKEVFNMFQNGYSINRILNEMNCKYGGWSGASRVSYTLKNPVYIGKVRFKNTEYDGVHEPIISKEQFQTVQSLLCSQEREDNKTTSQKSPFRASYLLTGLIRCGNCGARYSGGHEYYKCYSVSKNSKKFIKDPNCNAPKFKIEELDEYIINKLLKLKTDPKYLESILSDAPVNKKNDSKNKIKNIEKQIVKLLDLYQFGNIPVDEINKRVTELQEKKEKLINKIEKSPKSHINEFKTAIDSIEEVISNGEFEAKRLLVSTLIEEIIIDSKDISIKWRV